jgi:hypothetical protein
MERVTANLRVLIEMSDGRYGVYGWDGIESARVLRDHLTEAGMVFSDPQVCDTDPPMPTSVRAVFDDPQTKPWGQS